MLDNRIDTFLYVCKYMSYTKAAAELHITQPAVSQHIKYLEGYYNTKLFSQNGKKLSLTDSGHILFDKLNKMKNDELKIMDALASANDNTATISFGVTMTIGEYVIADPISKYLSKNPDVNFKIRYGNTKTLLELLQNGEIDFALVEGYFPMNEYETLRFSTEDFIPVCNSTHHFVKRPQNINDLFEERLLIREPGSGTRNILERSLATQNYSIEDFRHYIQVENMHSIIQLLTMDCGISFLYKAAVKNELANNILKEINLKDFKIKHDFTFLWQKESIFSEEIRRICLDLSN